MDVLEEVQPLWTYLRKCYPYGRTSGRANHYGRTSGSATLMDVLEEVQPLWT